MWFDFAMISAFKWAREGTDPKCRWFCHDSESEWVARCVKVGADKKEIPSSAFLLSFHEIWIPLHFFPLSFDSRALGDFEYKNVDGKGPTEQLVSPEPEFYIKVKKQRPCFRTLINLEIILVSFTSSRSSLKPCFCGCSSAHPLIIELHRKY